ncbi:DUF3783 domain-containing protein [Brotonthovivens ammoniilytica]|uniref:DUF3783 domain-containing protein n=1 Tax=Brotonthovivens ammoniilytica TaxID=2981725 RepID=A0ABT2TNA8_9FIRM|nr:DUF3783 domain-containing protein [Brotonthovivens ammoniilytica]MCU6762944.1 DUF3783 domain-containing protein [Brotonthovivens ammoniilytica]
MYNLDSEKGRKIKMICLKMKLRIIMVSSGQYLEPIGSLAGVSGIEPAGTVYEGNGFGDEMLVFKGFDNGTLDRFLRELKASGAGKVSLKAILTPDNVVWSSLELYEELKKEHEALNS